MSIRNFDRLFQPQVMALIGASRRPSSVGAVVARNLRRDGFRGELFFANRHPDNLDGASVHPHVASRGERTGEHRGATQ
jgi:acetyltransferase